MDIDVTHLRNPVLGWDIQSTAKAAAGETITAARIDVNGSPVYDRQISPPVNKWQRTLTQQGQYPGENKVLVTITNDKSEQTKTQDEWE
jgi:hypothetical protein